MPTAAEVRPGKSQELGIYQGLLHEWQGSKDLGHQLLLPGCTTRSWMGNKGAGTQTGTPGLDVSHTNGNFTCLCYSAHPSTQVFEGEVNPELE